MKIVNKKNLLSAGMAIAMAIGASIYGTGCATSSSGDQMKPMKGGEHLLMVNPINTKQDLDALKTDDSIAMVCAKCKTVWVTRVKEGVKGAQILMAGGRPTEVIGTHACNGCRSTLEVVGVQKGASLELKHTCRACGDNSAFCCAVKPGSGATPGM